MTVAEKKILQTFIAAHKRRWKSVWSTISQYLLVNVGPIEWILSILDNESHTDQWRVAERRSARKNEKNHLCKYSKTFQTAARTESTPERRVCVASTHYYSVKMQFFLSLSLSLFLASLFLTTTALRIALRLKSVRSFYFCFWQVKQQTKWEWHSAHVHNRMAIRMRRKISKKNGWKMK